ncbi:hypothetical protein LIS77_03780 [Cytobacillus firmus]|uniref:hypothetical protein n=1 Tax=Cytobacillus firmus TaxID=1399 RepID=UPI00207937F5|nr:hypothetical protein [Cytobacillus firmus]USK39658.1 hypothetical protein LIS77_03780 [Cytobacillus firmus]
MNLFTFALAGLNAGDILFQLLAFAFFFDHSWDPCHLLFYFQEKKRQVKANGRKAGSNPF